MEKLTHGSLFSGIGGFDLAAEWAGWENKFHCEWNEFGKRVLNYYWPEVECYGDITKTDFTKYRGRIDVLTGGFPCQPYSVAGKRLGKEDERHLWPHMLRAIREIKPKYVVGENVRGIISWNGGLVFDEVQADLEAEGYEVLPFLLPAAGVNAPHERYRIWFIAHSKNKRGETRERESINRSEWENEKYKPLNGNTVRNRIEPNGISWNATNSSSIGRFQNDIEQQADKSEHARTGWDFFPTQPPVCGGDDGLSCELDGITFPKWRSESIKAYGNAIVPAVAFEIFKVINEIDNFLNENSYLL